MILSEAILDDISRLEFKDGADELIYHEDENGRHWMGGHENFHRMGIGRTDSGEAYVTMTLVNNNGLAVTQDPDRKVLHTYTDPHKLKQIGSLIAYSAVLFEDTPDWIWHIQTVPLPATMNAFAQEYLQPLGTHRLPLKLMEGSGHDNLFTPTEMVHAIADGVMPVSATARHLWHDMKSHSLGYLSLSGSTMNALQSVCQYLCDIECEDALEIESLNTVMMNLMDYYTFEKFFLTFEVSNGCSSLLSDFLSHPYVVGSPFKKGILSTVRESGLEVTRRGHIVRDDHTNRTYQLLRTFFDKNGLPMFVEPAK